ncbi:unnamed protein product [Peronospora belbahrii]|uniref:RRM domain-containing protein n=1 Tax=Peronospora belbahrii TaxID=622444 RepID=A0AAU9KSB5_9STRA|nr:unnamed protein product [Peronospora belbahrii]CAH0515035.1 unnamed protein product [Peronospora belbahrii]
MGSPTSVRVYVGGLTSTITTQELQERFGQFVFNSKDCQLTCVELPKPKTLENSVASSINCRGFAYLTFQGADAATQSEALQKTYNRTKWRGNLLKVQVAKPHFELKLKQEKEERERERKERELKRQKHLKQINTPVEVVEPLKLTVTFKGRKKTEFSNVDETKCARKEKAKVETDIETLESEAGDTESESENEKVEAEALGEDDVEMFVRKMEAEAAAMNQDKEKKVLSRETMNARRLAALGPKHKQKKEEMLAISAKEKKVLSKEEMNARRLAALEAKQKGKKEEKLVIPAIGEAVGNKKITFDDSGNEQETEEPEEEDAGVVLNWMDSSDDDADGHETERRDRKTFDFTDSDIAETTAANAKAQAAFAVRPEFVGEMGKKLFEMQKRFGGDSRFHLDARFLEDEANEYGGNDMEDDEQHVDETSIAELQNFLEEEGLQEAACHAREMREEEEAALRVVSKLFSDVDVTRLQRRMQEQRMPKDPLKEAAWMGELKRYDPRNADACREFEMPMSIASSRAQENETKIVLPKRGEKEIPTGGDRFFSTAGDLSNLFSRVRKNSEDGEEGEAALDGVFGSGTATTQSGSDAPFKLSSLFSFPAGEDKPLAAMGEQLLEDEQETAPSAVDWTFLHGYHSTDDMVDEAMTTDSEAGDDGEDEEQTKAALTKARAKKSYEDFIAFGKTFVAGRDVADWPERRRKLTLDYKRKRRDAVKVKKRQNKQQNKANKTKTDANATDTATSSKWKKARL